MNETTLQNRIRLAATSLGFRLFRNQVGTYVLKDGRVLTSGLSPGSSDLIGWKSIVVTKEMCGDRIAVFTSIEVKRPGQKPRENQLKWMDVVERDGGIACVITDPEQIKSI